MNLIFLVFGDYDSSDLLCFIFTIHNVYLFLLFVSHSGYLPALPIIFKKKQALCFIDFSLCFLFHCFLPFITYPLLFALGLSCFIFLGSWDVSLYYLFETSSFLIYTCRVIHFSSNTAIAVTHTLPYAAFSFSVHSMYFLTSFGNFSLVP